MTEEATCSQRRPSMPPASRDCIKILRFFIFNSSFGLREGEEVKRIVYYFGQHEDSEEQRTKQVGLIEAIIKFSSVFSNSPCQSLHTQKSRTVLYEAEPGFVLVLSVSVPCLAKPKRTPHQSDAAASVTEYVFLPENVHENKLRAALIRAYDMFRLFTGGFHHLQPDTDRQLFKHRVAVFFSRYLSSMCVDNSDVSELFESVQFLTLESRSFLQVQSFVNRLQSEFSPIIDASILLHQGFVAWSGLQQKETALLYRYVYTSLLPLAMQKSAHPHVTSSSSLSPFAGHQGHFLTGPQPQHLYPAANESGDSACLTVPEIFVATSTDCSELSQFHLVVYHALSATLCLLVPIQIELTLSLFQKLDGHLGPRLTHLSADLHDVFGRSSGAMAAAAMAEAAVMAAVAGTSITSAAAVMESEDEYQFLYYNQANRAMKNTLNCKVSPQGQLIQHLDENPEHKEAAHAICDLHHDFTRLNDRGYCGSQGLPSITSEISVKLPGDQWVVGRKENEREVYTVIPSKNANLIDVGDLMNRMMSFEFKTICLFSK